MGDRAPELCRVCNRSREEHNSSEIHHLFSEDGQLRRKPPARKVAISQSVPDRVAARLAAIMLERQLIDARDFEFILTGRREVLDAIDNTDRAHGPAARRDLEDRDRPAADGGLRDTPAD